MWIGESLGWGEEKINLCFFFLWRYQLEVGFTLTHSFQEIDQGFIDLPQIYHIEYQWCWLGTGHQIDEFSLEVLHLPSRDLFWNSDEIFVSIPDEKHVLNYWNMYPMPMKRNPKSRWRRPINFHFNLFWISIILRAKQLRYTWIDWVFKFKITAESYNYKDTID